LAIFGVSFRLLAKAVIPVAVLFILAGCRGSTAQTTTTGTVVSGSGFTVEVPQGWTVSRPRATVVGRHGGEIVSVTRFSLRKPYDPGQFDAVAKTLDAVVARLAKAAGGAVEKSVTTTVSGRKIRAYDYDNGKRIGFVLDGSSEYQLYCARGGDACDLLFGSFQLT
jgi:hypothetical protein